MQNEKRCEVHSNAIILIAEDDPDSREALVSFIEPELPSFGFLQAANGVDALKAYHDHRSRVALVLTDNDMPGKTGHELLLDLRKLDLSLPIVMISGDKKPAFVRILRESGLTEFLSKPVDGNRVVQTIRQILSA